MQRARTLVRAAWERLRDREPRGFIVLPEHAGTAEGRHKKVLFFRRFGRFQGGHLKLWHYYNHVAASGTHMPYVRFSRDSVWDDSNPWKQSGQRVVPEGELAIEPDLYFLGARDWAHLDPRIRHDSPVPVLNLIQNVRHADERDESYGYLEHKAIRVCIDPAVERAVLATGRVNGPVFTIQDATDVACVEESRLEPRNVDVLIVGMKRPDIGTRLHGVLGAQGIRTKLLDSLVPRPELFENLRDARVTLFLPNPVEGAYLPPVEGMAFATIVVCPDIEGASYCADGRNCLRPPYREDAMIDAVQRALTLPPSERESLIDEGFRTVRTLKLDAERASFVDILRRAEELWRDET